MPRSRLLDDIHTHQVCHRTKRNPWIEINCNSGWSVKMGNSKRARLLRELEGAGIIECDHDYLYGSYGSKAKSYRFSGKFFGLIPGVEKGELLLKKRKAKKPRPDEVEGLDPVLYTAIKANISQLTHNDEELGAFFDRLGRGAKAWKTLQRICNGFKEGAVVFTKGRIFIPPQQVPRSCRSAVVHRDGKQIKDVDIKSCHPTFLFSLYKGMSQSELAEMAVYREYFQAGFYERISENVGTRMPRKRAKRLFNTFLNDREWSRESIRKEKFNQLGQAFCDLFPILFSRMEEFVAKNRQELMSKRGGVSIGIGFMAMELKVLEPVYLELTRKGVWWLPFHDGFIVEEAGTTLAVEVALQSLGKVIGMGDVKVTSWTE